MTTAAPSPSRRPRLAAVCLLTLLLAACTGRGGGQLPPDALHSGAASFGFSVSCEDKGGINPQTGQLRIQLSYGDRGTQLPQGSLMRLSPFSVHGVVDEVDPVEESMLCSASEPLRTPGELVFLGRYRVTSASAGFPADCARELSASSCRFEVVVQDTDRSATPSSGDWFSIRLSTMTSTTSSKPVECPDGASLPCYVTEFGDDRVVYARAGHLSSGNLTVD